MTPDQEDMLNDAESQLCKHGRLREICNRCDEEEDSIGEQEYHQRNNIDLN